MDTTMEMLSSFFLLWVLIFFPDEWNLIMINELAMKNFQAIKAC